MIELQRCRVGVVKLIGRKIDIVGNYIAGPSAYFLYRVSD